MGFRPGILSKKNEVHDFMNLIYYNTIELFAKLHPHGVSTI